MNKELNNQYHFPVCAGLHIMLEAEEEQLIYEKEHMLGTGSKSIDCLIIKKEKTFQIKTDIGQIFRGHNLVEIKGYRDTLSVDKYYKALGYALFYKADGGKANSIDIEDITLTFICTYMPTKLLKHMKRIWKIECMEKWKGIYYLEGFVIPMQLIVASRLDKKEKYLLRNLLMPLREEDQLQKIYDSYGKHRNNKYYEEVINFIIYKDREFIRRKSEMVQVAEGLREFIYEAAEEKAQSMAKDMAQNMAKETLKEKAREKAIEMLKDGLSCEKTSKYSGLTVEEIKLLQRELLQSM